MISNILIELQNFKDQYVSSPQHIIFTKTNFNAYDIFGDLMYINDSSQKYINSLQTIYEARIDDVLLRTSLPNSSSQQKFSKYVLFFIAFLKLNKFLQVQNNSIIDISYIPDPSLGNKTIRDPNNPLGQEDVNSGVCWGNNVLVYRKEEAPKVLLHEMIHLFKLDMGVKTPPYIQKQYFIESPVPIRFTETYTELLAAILFTYYRSKKTNIHKIFDRFQNQADKVMCIYWNAQQKKFVQNTHVFEYIVAKAALCEYFRHDPKALINLLMESKEIFSDTLAKALDKYISSYTCSLSSVS